MSSIKLQPKVGPIRCISTEMAKMSITLKHMLENVEDMEKVVPLPQISGPVLDKVVDWMHYHLDDPIESEEDTDNDESCDKCNEDINPWDKQFYSVDRELLFDLIVAANFLDIKDLLKTGCKIAAEQLNGKSAEEVRKLWDIECDLDPNEEERLKRENAWTDK